MNKLFLCFALVLLFTNCGGVKPTKIDEFNLTVDLPSGWKMYKNNFQGKLTIEFSGAGRRILNITEANPSVKSLEMLEKASSKSFKVVDKESFASGFGVTLQTKKGKQFRYYLEKDGKQYMFEPAFYYKDTDYNKALAIVKSAR